MNPEQSNEFFLWCGVAAFGRAKLDGLEHDAVYVRNFAYKLYERHKPTRCDALENNITAALEKSPRQMKAEYLARCCRCCAEFTAIPGLCMHMGENQYHHHCPVCDLPLRMAIYQEVMLSEPWDDYIRRVTNHMKIKDGVPA